MFFPTTAAGCLARCVLASDPTDMVFESDSDPLNDDNVAVFVGAYATTTTILVHGGSAADSVTVTYPAVATGNFDAGDDRVGECDLQRRLPDSGSVSREDSYGSQKLAARR